MPLMRRKRERSALKQLVNFSFDHRGLPHVSLCFKLQQELFPLRCSAAIQTNILSVFLNLGTILNMMGFFMDTEELASVVRDLDEDRQCLTYLRD